MSGYDDDESVGACTLNVLHDLETIHIRHNNVQKNEIETFLRQAHNGFATGIADADVIALSAQEHAEALTHPWFIVYDQ
jgi:hypothetical protein